MLTNIWNAIFEPRYPRRYIGRHRAPLSLRYASAAGVRATEPSIAN